VILALDRVIEVVVANEVIGKGWQHHTRVRPDGDEYQRQRQQQQQNLVHAHESGPLSVPGHKY
jgi:hypothetical protein